MGGWGYHVRLQNRAILWSDDEVKVRSMACGGWAPVAGGATPRESPHAPNSMLGAEAAELS